MNRSGVGRSGGSGLGWAAAAAVGLHAAVLAVAGLPLQGTAPASPRVLQAWVVASGDDLPPVPLAPAQPAAAVAAAPAAAPPEPQAVASPRAEPVPVAAGPGRHLPPSVLDRAPLPLSAPDETLLDAVAATGLPVRLRLYIEADGRVSAVQVLAASAFDREAAARMQQMFLATAFMPGRVDGRDVASFMDVEVQLAATPAGVAALP
jgi:outer membrane biosynthesis protein TonB